MLETDFPNLVKRISYPDAEYISHKTGASFGVVEDATRIEFKLTPKDDEVF